MNKTVRSWIAAESAIVAAGGAASWSTGTDAQVNSQ
jgi:hypothetical protein